MDVNIGRSEDVIKRHHKSFPSGSSRDVISTCDKYVENTSFGHAFAHWVFCDKDHLDVHYVIH